MGRRGEGGQSAAEVSGVGTEWVAMGGVRGCPQWGGHQLGPAACFWGLGG